ncbi:MAG TPA: tetratricopeptide repeat protein [Fluviicoccus sp.]|nr:tetratricopeptide repeat protein [Fluviicoccus sp.]
MSYSEEEQVEKLKRFWQDYGTSILVGVSLALAVFAGWRYWEQSRQQTAANAAAAYQAALEASQKLAADPNDKASNTELQKQSLKVIQEYAGTPYAINTALMLSRHAMDVGDLKEAEKHLRWVLEQKIDDGIRSLATLRLARVLADKGDAKAAQALLDQDKLASSLPTREELRGDILRSAGDVAGARKAYEAAAKALVERQESRPLLDAKLADVGVEAPEIKRPSPVLEEKGA